MSLEARLPSTLEGRHMPVGAEVQKQGGVHFRVWAPLWQEIKVKYADQADLADAQVAALTNEGDGYFSGFVPDAQAGTCYCFQTGSGCFPDPASKFQPEGPHGPSQVVDIAAFPWTDQNWLGLEHRDLVIYELHVGTFTHLGTWSAAEEKLADLAELGITMVEVMPVADFPGRFGWGYDGVNLFAPYHQYGSPQDFQRFVNRAHELGIGVILDVVYNHLGPDGNYLSQYSEDYKSQVKTEWGDALNFDGNNAEPVREYFIQNALYWIRDYHLDGLRFDAIHQIVDTSPEHILGAIARRARQLSMKKLFLVAENDLQTAFITQPPAKNGCGLDAMWNDDFHHSAIVALTGKNEAYFANYHGFPQEFISACKRGFLYQGQYDPWRKQARGTSGLDMGPDNFVAFIQNHDQVANSLWGRRIHELASPGQLRAMTALLLLGPCIPMLFQGQEFASSSPFLYFGEHKPDLARAVAEGRAEFLSQFPSIATTAARAMLRNPEREDTFQLCKLNHEDREKNHGVYHMHGDLIRLRKSDPVIKNRQKGSYDGAVLNATSFLLRYFDETHGDRLLIINQGQGYRLAHAPEPLLAPPEGREWSLIWSSEDVKYGGSGTPPIQSEDQGWLLPAQSALFFEC